MNRRGSLLALIAGAVGVLSGRSAGAEPKRHRAVLDLNADGAERWDGALRNAENLRRALGPENVEVHLVVHGKAYPLLQKTNGAMEERLRSLQESGVRLALCRNTMQRFNVARETLFPFVDTVDSAAAELVRKQGEGWAYLKVGS
jgi:uncharacterized protein